MNSIPNQNQLTALLTACLVMCGSQYVNAGALTYSGEEYSITVKGLPNPGARLIDFQLPAPNNKFGSFTDGYLEIAVVRYVVNGGFSVFDSSYSVHVTPYVSMTVEGHYGENTRLGVGGLSISDSFYRYSMLDDQGNKEYYSIYRTSPITNWYGAKFDLSQGFSGGNAAIFDTSELSAHGSDPKFDCKDSISCVSGYLGNRSYIATIEMKYSYTHDSSTQSWLDEASVWIDNISDSILSGELMKTYSPKSIHTVDARAPASLGIRDGGAWELNGAVFNGKSIFTQSPGMLVYDITLPDAPSFNLPMMFEENNLGASIEVQFNGITLYQASGEDFTLNEMTILDLDIDAYRGQTGELSIILDNDGGQSARVFVPESIVLDEVQVTNYAPVPEPDSYALMLAGLGLVGFAARRRMQS